MASDVAGVILAGGKSIRMGENKALLNFKGRPLIEHMKAILNQTGIRDVFISGYVPGYGGVEDDKPFAGPAQAMMSIMRQKRGYKKYLFVPVDMPLLIPDMLQILVTCERGGYFTGWPLPVCLVPPCGESASVSVKAYLDDLQVSAVDIPDSFAATMKNANTPQDWKEVLLAL